MKSSDNAEHADNQQVSGIRRISDEYLAGFVDGEGCFYVGFGKREDLPLKWQVITEFHLSQNPQGKNILDAFRKRLGCGYIKPNHPGSARDKTWVLIIKDRKELKEKLIPFFNKHPLHSGKKDDFIVFAKVLEIIQTGAHLEIKGLKAIVEMVFRSSKTKSKRYSKQEIVSSLNLRDYTPDPIINRKDIVRTA